MNDLKVLQAYKDGFADGMAKAIAMLESGVDEVYDNVCKDTALALQKRLNGGYVKGEWLVFWSKDRPDNTIEFACEYAGYHGNWTIYTHISRLRFIDSTIDLSYSVEHVMEQHKARIPRGES